MNLVKKVAIVDIQTALCDWFLDSSDICIPKASDKESATAIVKTQPITKTEDPLPKASHTINPSVVMIHEVAQKLKPVLSEFFIILYRFKVYFHRFSSLQKPQKFFLSFYKISMSIII